MKKTLGGNRLGSGNKMQIDLHGYGRSTHDMGYLWRSTMSSGTLVPFLTEVALPGDTFDINLDCDIKTHPTIGPLFGSYKVQLDIFLCPIRLYQGQLHNNKLGIGMNMANIKLPQIHLRATIIDAEHTDYDNSQINPSSILSYLGIRGVGTTTVGGSDDLRNFNAIPLLAYWDIYKNYYANKQEEQGAVIHNEITTVEELVESIEVVGESGSFTLSNGTLIYELVMGYPVISINITPGTLDPNDIIIHTNTTDVPLGSILFSNTSLTMGGGGTITGQLNLDSFGGATYLLGWDYIDESMTPIMPPTVVLFDLNNLDEMREAILTATEIAAPFSVNAENIEPYSLLLDLAAGRNAYMQTQEGLAVKTYQSDLFNNWLSTEWIDGVGGINEITAIDTSGGSFTIDTLNLSKKVYDMLNRIAVSGGSYDDWLDVNWDHDRFVRAETPMYMGGLIKELVFQEVVSNSESGGTQTPSQPLGTLAGKGVLAKKHKGGKITVKVDEPSYIIGIISLTPRLDYSQGNKWDTHLQTMDDFHKPALDEIGFQELITEQMAWWTTEKIAGVWTTKSAGKQPAWINYMTNVNQTKGNFAMKNNEMFMTLNRRYENDNLGNILDLTTYIDPVKFNNIFAETALDAQNFWAQIAVDITARRKMSAKVMPNL